MSEITIVKVEPQVVIGMRKRGAYRQVGQMIRSLLQFGAENDAQLQGPPIFICHEAGKAKTVQPDKEDNADLQVVIPVAGKVKETDEIKCYELPGAVMAKIIHKGHYKGCLMAYKELFSWIERNGKQAVGPAREVYLNNLREVPAEELVTEIYVPIE